jgi:hypothetical protein
MQEGAEMRLFVYIRRMEITINGKTHPLFFSMNAIEKIMEANKMTDFAALGEAQNPAESLKFARICAFYGIKAGYKKQGKKCPYETAEDLGDDVQNFTELTAAMEGFSESVSGFFQVSPAEVKAESL